MCCADNHTPFHIDINIQQRASVGERSCCPVSGCVILTNVLDNQDNQALLSVVVIFTLSSFKLMSLKVGLILTASTNSIPRSRDPHLPNSELQTQQGDTGEKASFFLMG